MAAASPVVHSTTSTALRSPKRSRKRGKRVRPPQPQTPRDFFDADGLKLLSDLLCERATSWQNDWMRPIYFSGRDSEPHWDAYAQQPIAGTTLPDMKSECPCVSTGG